MFLSTFSIYAHLIFKRSDTALKMDNAMSKSTQKPRATRPSRATQALTIRLLLPIAAALAHTTETPAFAEEKAPPNADERAHAEATAHLNQASAAKNQGDWSTAAKHFAEAFKRWPNDTTAAELGEAELRSGQCSSAAEHLEWAAQHGRPDAIELRRRLDLATSAKQRTETLKLSTPVRDARLFLDGEDLGMGPIVGPLCVQPGRHRVEARRASGESAFKDIDIERGKGAVVRLDRFGKQAPVEDTYEVVREATPAWKVYGVYTGLGLMTAALGFGVGFALKYDKTNDEARLHHQWMENLYAKELYTVKQRVCGQTGAFHDCAQQDKMIEAARGNWIGTYVSFSLAGAFAIGTIIIAAMPASKKPKARTGTVYIEPVIARQTIGIQGKF